MSSIIGQFPRISPLVRSNLKERLGNPSVFFISYLVISDSNRISLSYNKGNPPPRGQVFELEWENVYVYLEADGTRKMDITFPLSQREQDYINLFCDELLEKNKEFVGREAAFLEAKPWEQLVGLTPQEAIGKLTEMDY